MISQASLYRFFKTKVPCPLSIQVPAYWTRLLGKVKDISFAIPPTWCNVLAKEGKNDESKKEGKTKNVGNMKVKIAQHYIICYYFIKCNQISFMAIIK